MIDLYYWGTPNGHKISIALEEMQLDYQIFPINISKNDQFQPEFLKISPNNKIPAIVDHDTFDGQPIAIFESGAILQYLGRKTGLFYPSAERQRIEVEQWLMWQMGGFGPMLGQNHHFSRFAPERLAYPTKRYQDETKRLYGVLDHRLHDRDYVAGEYSIADMAIFPWMLRYDWQSIDLNDFPNAKLYFERMQQREAVKKALAIQV
ncbi:MAG: glutathione S-transferase N-terminal domain-containing protein [Acinetobacter populi]|jgi:GST-like protein|uniref:glutathione S-transferase N-terminal domain-containing protein n=1 Tax=Acinetobacter populi TaxID=1582270 RepID=UPI002357CCCA|nr:glutathione S-transferase N-terminal domain-containing protein [Acinetobacter populi]MCH4247502.1 glutathione S-transferase N-terminal domain-containing protein [Acinetobacter populi]